jgi:hypothetical protein
MDYLFQDVLTRLATGRVDFAECGGVDASSGTYADARRSSMLFDMVQRSTGAHAMSLVRLDVVAAAIEGESEGDTMLSLCLSHPRAWRAKVQSHGDLLMGFLVVSGFVDEMSLAIGGTTVSAYKDLGPGSFVFAVDDASPLPLVSIPFHEVTCGGFVRTSVRIDAMYLALDNAHDRRQLAQRSVVVGDTPLRCMSGLFGMCDEDFTVSMHELNPAPSEVRLPNLRHVPIVVDHAVSLRKVTALLRGVDMWPQAGGCASHRAPLGLAALLESSLRRAGFQVDVAPGALITVGCCTGSSCEMIGSEAFGCEGGNTDMDDEACTHKLLVYLTDVGEGGEDVFKAGKCKYAVCPRAGRAVLFSQSARHRASRVLSGHKAVLTVEVRLSIAPGLSTSSHVQRPA